jgi:triosephosphate isomerase
MKGRKPFIAGNWKMHKTGPEAVETARDLVKRVSDVTDTDIMIAPAFTALSEVREALKGSPVALGAQNLFWETQGAYTGEVSPLMLTAAGCRYVIIGHSERRQFFGETDETVNKKIKTAAQHGLIPIFCVGETEAEREMQKTISVLDKQVRNGLKDIPFEDLKDVVLAYEPVWAIGTGKTATRDQVQEVHAFLRDLLAGILGRHLADAVRIQYGGSVKPGNIKELMEMPDVDGALVGGASLEAETFSKIVRFKQ